MNVRLKNGIKGDPVIWIAIAILCVYSLLAIFSGITSLSGKEKVFDMVNPGQELLRQLALVVCGLIIMWSLHAAKWRVILKKLAPVLLVIAWGLIVILLISGSSRDLKAFFISFQPFDIAKIALIIYMASILVDIKSISRDNKIVILKVFLPVWITCGLIVKENLSTALICFIVSLVMFFYGQLPMKRVFQFIGMSIAGAALVLLVDKAFNLEMFPRLETWENRIVAFVKPHDKDAVHEDEFIPLIKKPTEDMTKQEYQEFEARIAIGTGGIMGKGPGRGTQRYFLPKSYDDYIFSIIVEEYGILFGAVPLLVLYLILLFRGMRISLNSSRKFSSYLVFGVVFLYTFQAFLHIMVSVGLAPITGQPLPFVSKGGTALWVACAAFGLVLSESRINDKEKQKAEAALLEEQKEDITEDNDIEIEVA